MFDHLFEQLPKQIQSVNQPETFRSVTIMLEYWNLTWKFCDMFGSQLEPIHGKDSG